MQSKFLPPDLRSKVSTRNGNVELTSESEKLVVSRLLRELEPLVAAKKLGAFLLQLSPSFRPKNHALNELDSLWEKFAGFRMAVELRNRDWVSGAQFEETKQYFTSRKVALVLVDAPESEHFTVMPNFNCSTSPKLGYFRLHGRNAEGYVRGRSVAEPCRASY